jgi:hypothetical protein
MACAMQSFNNVTPSAWECCKKGVSQFGITVTANSGNQSKDDFTVAWNYDPAAQTLTIQCTDSPWWAPCSTINGKIHDMIQPCLGQITPMVQS